MSFTPTIKHANHRIYQVTQEKKKALIELLLAQNSDAAVLIVAQEKLPFLAENFSHAKLSLSEDGMLESLSPNYDIVISYDLPNEAQTYFRRLSLAKEKAFALLDAHEQNGLYQIEILLGRAIKQESLQGFGYPIKEEVKKEHKPREERSKQKSDHKKPYEKKSFDKTERPKRDGDFKREKKPFEKSDKPKREGDFKGEKKSYDKKPYDKSEKPKKAPQGKKQNKFLGYDENGKAIFSGKSGERNHRYDGKPKDAPKSEQPQTKKTGKTIQIKELKKQPEEK